MCWALFYHCFQTCSTSIFRIICPLIFRIILVSQKAQNGTQNSVKKVRENKEGHLDRPGVTEIHNGAVSISFWNNLKSFWCHFRTLFGPFWGDLCLSSQIRNKKQLKAARISQQQPATASKSQVWQAPRVAVSRWDPPINPLAPVRLGGLYVPWNPLSLLEPSVFRNIFVTVFWRIFC